jgi:predicted MFS family arabinose efflux permease
VPVPNGLTATRATVRWTIAELLANAGWTGVLVYAGALFVESYSASLTLTGFVLSGAAAAYVAGNLASRRLVEGDLRTHLVRLSALLAAGIAALGTLRHDLVVSALLLALCGSLAGGRTFLANVFGLQLAPERRLALMSARTAALNFGYFVGAGVGGAALALGGYAALGVALGTLVAAGTLQYADLRRGHVVTPRLRSA